MAIIRCPECGHEISDKAPFCPSCGVAIAGKVTVCPECGKVYFSDMAECPQCHHKTEKKLEEKAPAHIDTTACGSTSVQDAEPVREEKHEQEHNSEVVGCETPKSGNEPIYDNEQIRSNEPVHSNRPIHSDESVHSEEPMRDSEPIHSNEHKSSRNNKIIIAVVVVIAVIVVGICGYFYNSAKADNERQAYEYAMTSNDPQVLQQYLDNYLDAPEEHRDSIQAHLDQLNQLNQDWTNALVSGSKSALQQYIDQHPNSPFKAIALHKIDSIDWQTAQQQNTVEAIEAYLEQHPDGEHVDEANVSIKSLNSKTLQPEEKQMVSSIVNSFLQSLNNRDEDALTSVVNPLLTKFLGKNSATRSDVVTFMHKIYKSDVASMKWQSLGDYSINKKEVGDQEYEYSVTFSALQSVTSTDNTTTDSKYKISATINSDGRISEFNMIKILD